MIKVLVLLLTSLLNGDSDALTWNFEQDAPGARPAGFLFEQTGKTPPGQWEVVDDGGARVLAQIDRSRDPARYALAVVDDSKLRDVKVSVRIKIAAGDPEQAGGVAWRFQNAENYLAASLDVASRDLRLYRFVDGNRVQFAVEENLDVAPDRWYTLRVEHCGHKIKVYLDDEALLVERDRHFRRSGKIGLWTKSDAVVYFDDLEASRIVHPPRQPKAGAP